MLTLLGLEHAEIEQQLRTLDEGAWSRWQAPARAVLTSA